MNKELQHRLFALTRSSFPHVRVHIIEWAIEDVICELEEKIFRESVTLTPKEYFARCVQAVEWKLMDHHKTAHRYAPIEEAEQVADEFDIVKAMEKEEVIDEALKVLTDKERAVLLMQSSLDISYSGMAKICGVTKDAIKGVLANAKRKMQNVGNPPPSITVPI